MCPRCGAIRNENAAEFQRGNPQTDSTTSDLTHEEVLLRQGHDVLANNSYNGMYLY